MKVFDWNSVVQSQQSLLKNSSAITIGTFEACHRGHHRLFETLLGCNETEKGVVTFSSSPRIQLNAGNERKHLMTSEQKIHYFSNLGLSFVIMIDFSADFSKIAGDSFFDLLTRSLQFTTLVVGEDFKCGRNGEFGLESIQTYFKETGANLQIVPLLAETDIKISSTLIRETILSGNIALASHMLGRKYQVVWPKERRVYSEQGYLVADRNHFENVLPLNGKYRVEINGSVESIAELSNNRIMLPLSGMNPGEKVIYLNFI